VLHGTGEETFDAVKMLKAADPGKYTPAVARTIPRDALATACGNSPTHQANLGVQVACRHRRLDDHVNEGATEANSRTCSAISRNRSAAF